MELRQRLRLDFWHCVGSCRRDADAAGAAAGCWFDWRMAAPRASPRRCSTDRESVWRPSSKNRSFFFSFSFSPKWEFNEIKVNVHRSFNSRNTATIIIIIIIIIITIKRGPIGADGLLRNLRLFSLQVAKDVFHFAVNVRHFAFNPSLRLAQPRLEECHLLAYSRKEKKEETAEQ